MGPRKARQLPRCTPGPPRCLQPTALSVEQAAVRLAGQLGQKGLKSSGARTLTLGSSQLLCASCSICARSLQPAAQGGPWSILQCIHHLSQASEQSFAFRRAGSMRGLVVTPSAQPPPPGARTLTLGSSQLLCASCSICARSLQPAAQGNP